MIESHVCYNFFNVFLSTSFYKFSVNQG